MEFILNKEDFSEGIKIVEKITSLKGTNPIFANILIETIAGDRVKLAGTDMNLGIEVKVKAEVKKEGKITVNAKRLGEIVLRLEDKPVNIKLDSEKSIFEISCGRSKFELAGISAQEFPEVFPKSEDAALEKTFEVSKGIFNKAIKQTIFSAAQGEVSGVLGGVYVNIGENILEVVATDGNRLTRCRKPINSKNLNDNFIIPSKTLQELARISDIVEDESINFVIEKSKIYFVFENVKFFSRLIEGPYPKYQQLIPTTNEKIVELDRKEFINSIDRISTMVNERTNIMKLAFDKDILDVCTDSPETGSAKDTTEIEYAYEPIVIAFNYKYILDALKSMDSQKVKIEMSTNLSSTVFKPVDEEDENNYICLIMPVQVR